MRKNVLILGHDYTTPFIDIFNQYSSLFDAEKYEVTIAYLTGEQSDEIKHHTLAENIIFFDFSKKQIRSLKIHAIRQLLALTRHKKFDIVICHRYKPTYIMMWVARFHKIPTLIAVMHELGTMRSRKRQCLIAWLAPKNMLFAGVSNAVRDDIRNNLSCIPKNHIVTIYNAINVKRTESALLTKQQARENLQLSQDDFVFGNVARLVKNKDHETLLSAFALIKPHFPNAKLIIMGTGELAPFLKQKIQNLNLENEVLLTGYVKNAFSYMKAFDCFVLSSKQEAFGLVLLEAMIAKLPVIATRVNGIPEVVSKSGTIVDPENIASLSDAMQTILSLSNQQREMLGENAYQHAVKNFSTEKCYEVFWQLLVFNH